MFLRSLKCHPANRVGSPIGPCKQAGFSLAELVVVIVVLGILGASVAVFISGPIRSYFDTMRRAQLTDAADTVARRLTRELQAALPNSVRISVSGNTTWIEFVPIVDSGRYRAAASAGNEPSGNDALDTSNIADTQFQVLGRPVNVVSNSQLVIYNLGTSDLDAYVGANRRVISGATGARDVITFVPAADTLPADSPEHRFFIVQSPVSYACTSGANGSGQLERFDNYDFSASQPTSAAAAPLNAARNNLVVDKVLSCSITQSAPLANMNVVSLRLTLADQEDQVTLWTQIYIGNTP